MSPLSDIDKVRQYWDANPCNIRHSKAEIGTQEYFDQVEYRKYKVEPHIPAFAEFPKWYNKRVLEIGCGIGTDAVNFARHGAEYTGIELSKNSLELAEKRFQIYNLVGKFYCYDAETLLSENGKVYHRPICQAFDLVYSFGVIHHTPNPQRLIDGIVKALRPGGELRMMVYAHDSWKGIMIREGLDQPESRGACPIARTYTNNEVLGLLATFNQVSIEQTHIFPYDVEKYINHQYELTPWFRDMPKAMFAALERNLGWHLLVKATL